MAKARSAPVRNREATRNAILEATSQLVSERGVDGFTISEVALRGKVNRALIYHYFHDRERLIFETIRYIINRYDSVPTSATSDAFSRGLQFHIDHPEIARFILHLLLTGRPLPALSSRITTAIEQLERMKAAAAPDSPLDPAMGIIAGWLIQLTWSFARQEVARHLGITAEEADGRMLRHLRAATDLMIAGLGGQVRQPAAPAS
jgi:AcrR family transcriptional regulator